MRIAILGAGAMGLLFGGLLKKTGNNIKFIVRDKSKKKIINEKGITLNVDDKTHIVYPEAILSKEAKEFDIIIDDGRNKKSIRLDRPYIALHIKKGIWREMRNFTSGSVCMVMASLPYDKEDYIDNYKEYINADIILFDIQKL